MAGPFESATRVAIENIIQAHAQPSKFGYILTREGMTDLTDDLFNLLLTSRSVVAQSESLSELSYRRVHALVDDCSNPYRAFGGLAKLIPTKTENKMVQNSSCDSSGRTVGDAWLS